MRPARLARATLVLTCTKGRATGSARRLCVCHNVTDYKAWRKVYDEFDAERRKMGVSGHAVFQSVDDSNDVTVWHDFSTPDQAKRFALSQRLKEAMAKARVKGGGLGVTDPAACEVVLDLPAPAPAAKK